MKFSYKAIELPPGERREFLLKPIVPIWLFHKKSFIRLEALIDSGADFTVFHSEVAQALNIVWKKGIPHVFYGITGSKGTVYFHSLSFKIGKWTKKISCGFSNDLSEESYGILGQEGFFENFKIAFDFASETIRITP